MLNFLTRLLAFVVSIGEQVYEHFGVAGLAVLIGLGLGAVWALFRYGGTLLFWLLWRNFTLHGKVLRNAKIEIHSITPAPEPEPEIEDLEFEEHLENVPEHAGHDDPGLNYFFLEVTITPADNANNVDGWHPSHLMLVAAGRDKVELFEIDGAGFIVDGWAVQREKLARLGAQVFHDAARLKLHIGVHPDCRRLRFLYMKEVFGEIVIPDLSGGLPPPPRPMRQWPPLVR